MARSFAARGRRQRIFLEALMGGSSVVEASVLSRVTRSTLYFWREHDAAFRIAWDAASRSGMEATATRLDDEMMRRALEGVTEPVFYNGEIVGERRRYSDALLMFGIRDLRMRQQATRDYGGDAPSANPKVTVVVRQFGAPAEDPRKMGENK